LGRYTDSTRSWLDTRFAMRDAHGVYNAHQPVYGFNHPGCEPRHLVRFARTFGILRALDGLSFRTLCDVGGGEGFVAKLATDLFGCAAVVCDLSTEACHRAFELFGLPGVSAASARLPFADRSFDVVLCSEVVEHVEFPVETMLELARIARRAVILTTEEVEHDRDAIDEHLFQRCGHPHFDQNVFHPDDLRALFGTAATLRGQFRAARLREPVDPDTARRWILQATATDALTPDDAGVVLVAPVSDDAARDRRNDDRAILDLLFRPAAAAVPLAPRPRVAPDPMLTERLACPVCRAALATAGDAFVCGRCAIRAPLDRGVPVFGAGIPDPSRAELEARLARSWPHDAARRDAVLRVRNDLALVTWPDKRVWDFRVCDERRGWLPGNQLVAVADDRGRFRFRSVGADPWIISPWLDARTVDIARVRVRMRVHNPARRRDEGVGQLFWICDGDLAFGEDRVATFPLVNDGEVHDYSVALEDHPAWPDHGHVTCVRLDPANGECDIELIGFALER
jgi:hypothetical protein